ncbi:MAG: glycosyltransferase family 9 protein [Bacteroidetes bacterium]|nr:glycosyltransferase family 9 protein [Bacteroidota bacterium]
MKKILIVRTDKIGDMVLTLPMAQAIKLADPECRVVFMSQPYTTPIVKLSRFVDEIVEYDGSYYWGLIKAFRRIRPDAVVLLSPKARYAIASFFAGIPIRVGKGYRWYSFFTNRNVFEHRRTAERNEAAYNLRMLASLGIDADEELLPQLDLSILPTVSIPTQPYIVLHTQTGGSAPIWDADKWSELGSALNQTFGFPVVLTGTAFESEFLFTLCERMKHSRLDVHIQPQSDLATLCSVLSKAALVIAGSTGPGHIAAALGTPTIGLFPRATALSKERWGFRGKRAINLDATVAPRPECPQCKNCNCVSSITIGQVIDAARTLMNQ